MLYIIPDSVQFIKSSFPPSAARYLYGQAPKRERVVIWPRHLSPLHSHLFFTTYTLPSNPLDMNTFANRFSTTSAEAEIQRARDIFEDEDGSETMWGSQAGFGALARGVPKFAVPSVPDVCLLVPIGGTR